MARTQQEIYDALITAKTSHTELDALSNSNVAIWKLWLHVVAFALWLHETLWDNAKAEINTIAARAVPGTVEWYIKKIKEFQKGDILQIDPNTLIPYYGNVNDTKKIISRAAVVEQNGSLIIKVAKNKTPERLTNGTGTDPDNELNQLEGYIDAIKFAGTRFTLISSIPDLISCARTVGSVTTKSKIWYDAQYNEVALAEAIDTSINNYLANLPFNGILRKSDFEAAVKSTPGVIDFELYILRCSSNNGTAWTNLVEPDDNGNPATKAPTYLPFSGYFIINAFAIDMFEFIPDVQ